MSDAYNLPQRFNKDTYEPDLELKVTMLNINLGNNAKLLEACQTLKEYSMYVARVRSYTSILSLEESVNRAITECIKENILKEFLIKYKSEAKSMSIFEYDEEKEMALIRADEREQGSTKKLISMVCRKLQKEKTPEQIAEDLEEELIIIKNICEAAKKSASYNCDEIYDLMRK